MLYVSFIIQISQQLLSPVSRLSSIFISSHYVRDWSYSTVELLENIRLYEQNARPISPKTFLNCCMPSCWCNKFSFPFRRVYFLQTNRFLLKAVKMTSFPQTIFYSILCKRIFSKFLVYILQQNKKYFVKFLLILMKDLIFNG